ncbi:hypothetical protein B0H10DRAFT_1996001 [Mycena sp. CBHHK59/15]|nr:hypothetical protein B0H10DRAFT_1996001 [Mycena sp. CBHHK59/15]
MLVTLYFLPLLPMTYAATQIICASDPTVSFTPGWSQAISQTTQDLFMLTDFFDASFTVSLPTSASSVSYIGYKRTGGSKYGYCIDCAGSSNTILKTAEGNDPSLTDDADAPEVHMCYPLTLDFYPLLQATLFSIFLDPSTQHTLSIYNIPDDSFEGESEITFDHLLVSRSSDPSPTISNDPVPLTSVNLLTGTTSVPSTSTPGPTSVPSTSTPSTTSSIGPSSSSSGPATDTVLQSTPSSTTGTANASSSGVAGRPIKLSTSLIAVIAVLSVAFVLSVVVGAFFLLRSRQQRRRSFRSSQLSPTSSIIPIMPPPPMRMASPRPASPQPSSPRPTNPYGPPNIPLPALPLDRPINSSLMQKRFDSRSDSPASASLTQSDLWIARPVQRQ